MSRILIVAHPDDVHARCVSQELARLGRGGDVGFLDRSSCGSGLLLRISIDRAGGALFRTSEGLDLRCADVGAVWLRRPEPPTLPQDMLDPEDRRFAEQEGMHAYEGLLARIQARFVNPPVAQARAGNKPLQLMLARQAGLRIPDTLVTNDRSEVDAFLDLHAGRVVHKALSPPPRLLETLAWSEGARANLENLRAAPTMFQERIDGRWDIRATVIGERILAARVDRTGLGARIDSRLQLDAPYEAFELPPRTRDGLLALHRALGLVFGAVDLRETDEGEHVFFEVNPQGQFLYIEVLTGLPLAATMASFLADLAAR